jgi:murein L,D-transpeptidase YafK
LRLRSRRREEACASSTAQFLGKATEGDHQVLEGFYEITPERLNPFSYWYLAFDVGAPFLNMLKSGSDAFTATGAPPRVAFCLEENI